MRNNRSQNPDLSYILDKNSRTIGLDLDGVCASSRKFFLSEISRKYDVDIPATSIYDRSPAIPKVDTTFGEEIDEIARTKVSQYRKVDAISGSAQATKTLSSVYDIKIISHRVSEDWLSKEQRESMEEVSKDWMNQNNITYDEFVSPTPGDKTDIEADIYIDDKPRVISNISSHPNKVGILFVRPHNFESIPRDAWVVSNYDESLSPQDLAKNPQRQWGIITDALLSIK